MSRDVTTPVLGKRLKSIATTFFVFAAAASYGNTEWHSNTAKHTGLQVEGNEALTNMVYWKDGNGNVGSGAPTASDDLVFDNNATSGSLPLRLRFSKVDFTGNSLQIGTDARSSTVVFDSTPFACANEGLKLKHGHWWFNSGPGADRRITCDVTVLAEDATKPFVLHWGQHQYSNGVGRIIGKLKGGVNAQIRFGSWDSKLGDTKPLCACNSTFRLSDISEYAGTITVAAHSYYTNFLGDANNYGTRLWLDTGTTTSPAKLNILRGGSLKLANRSDVVTVKELSLAGGSRLWFDHTSEFSDGTTWHVRATDALTVEKGTEKVEVLWKPIVRGQTHFRIPILSGPADSTFTADDFKLTFCATQYNLDMHFEVDNDPETGDRTLYVSTHGFVIQQTNYTDEGIRDGNRGAPSSLTNAVAWWQSWIPGPDTTGALYRTAVNLRTLYAPGEAFSFPCAGFWVNKGTLIIQTHTFEVPEFWCNGGTFGAGQGHWGVDNIVSLIAPKIHFFGDEASALYIRAYEGQTFVLKGEIDGSHSIRLLGWGGTGAPKVQYMLDGPNTNFTGAITVSTGEVRPAYHNFDNLFPTLYVLDGRNLGGRMPTFNPRALTLTTLARLSMTNGNTVTLADGLNRGVYIKASGRFHVTGAGTLDVKWPLLLSGKMWKEGAGTLVLGGEMKHEAHDNGTLTDVPRAGSNLFEMVSGTVKIAHADALAGVETTIDSGASLKLAIDPSNADLTAYGIRNTTVDTPFTLAASFGGKLPLTLATEDYALPEDCHAITNALVTVKDSSAAAVRAMLPAIHPWKPSGLTSTVVPRVNLGEDTTTFLLVSKVSGLTVIFR